MCIGQWQTANKTKTNYKQFEIHAHLVCGFRRLWGRVGRACCVWTIGCKWSTVILETEKGWIVNYDRPKFRKNVSVWIAEDVSEQECDDATISDSRPFAIIKRNQNDPRLYRFYILIQIVSESCEYVIRVALTSTERNHNISSTKSEDMNSTKSSYRPDMISNAKQSEWRRLSVFHHHCQ
jgi:hypothetical protein